MKILVTGANGMLGRDLIAELNREHDVTGIDLADGDLTECGIARMIIADAQPEWVINCAAYTKVDQAESEPDLARKANVDAARHVALVCKEIGARLIHLSTDYVFDGEKAEPYLPTDRTRPLGVYGITKQRGEQEVIELLGNDAAVIRTAWLYGPHGHNFVKAILAQIEQGKPLRVVDDQTGSPTYTGHLAPALAAAIRADLRGVHHATNSGFCSWYDFATRICEYSGHAGWSVAPIATAKLNRPAPRPKNSRLDLSSFTAATGFAMPPWQEGLKAYLQRTLG